MIITTHGDVMRTSILHFIQLTGLHCGEYLLISK